MSNGFSQGLTRQKGYVPKGETSAEIRCTKGFRFRKVVPPVAALDVRMTLGPAKTLSRI
jgi:hypothetical protein